LRRSAGLTGEQLAQQLGWPKSKVPKLENGRQMPSEADVTAWAEATGHPEAVPELLDLLSDAQAVHRQWRHRLRSGHAALQAEYDALIRGAKHIRNFEVSFVPGLLQTADYARSRVLEAVTVHGTTYDRVEETVAARTRRQDVLYDQDKTFEFVVTEAALRFLLCPPRVMLGQLDRLVVASVLSNVTFGIIPFGVELAVAPTVGFLTVDDVTIVETYTSDDMLPGQESAKYDRIFEQLMAESATGEEARRLIAAAAGALRG
jgi:transcriptional regulator with XRE-family HTH domain